MADEGKAIIFYRCNLFTFNFVSIDERPAMGSQPNLASRSEVVSINKCPTALPNNLGCKNTFNFGPLFSATSTLDTAYLGKETSHGQTKMIV